MTASHETDRSRPPSAPDMRRAAWHRNLEPLYDIATAVRAFALTRREIPTAQLIVAGSGPDRSALEALARELGVADGVQFTGQLDHRLPGRVIAFLLAMPEGQAGD